MSDRKKNPSKPQQRKPTQQQRRAQSQRDKAKNKSISKPKPSNQLDQKFESAPVAKSKTQRTRKPKMETRPNGDAHIVHREYVADIISGTGTPTAFKSTSYAINPGQAATFPWLSKVAANYESYVFNSFRVDYETEAPSSLGGTMILTVDYDASDPAPTTKQQAMTYRSAVRSAPWSACQHTSLSEDLHKSKTNFVRPGLQPSGTDIKTYDIGNLFAISQGVGNETATLGEIYVEYDVVLMTPVFEPSVSDIEGGQFISDGSLSTALPFGDGKAQLQANAFGITFSPDSKLAFTSTEQGLYLVVIHITGTGLTTISAAPSSGDIKVGEVQETVLADGSEVMTVYEVSVLAPGYITITCTGTTVTGAQGYVASAPLGSLT